MISISLASRYALATMCPSRVPADDARCVPLSWLALASLNHAGWDLAAAFPQGTMALDTTACGGLRSARDLLHHSHSWASPIRRRRFRITERDLQPAPEITHHRLIMRLSILQLYSGFIGVTPERFFT